MHNSFGLGETYELTRDLDFRPFGVLPQGTAFSVSYINVESNIIDLVPFHPLKELHEMDQVLCLVPGITTELEEALCKTEREETS